MPRLSSSTVSSEPDRRFDEGDGGFLVSDPEGRALYANRPITRRTGFSSGEIVGREPGKLWGGQMPRSFYVHLWETIGTRHEPFVETVTNRRKDRVSYPELLAVAPVTDKKGKLEYFIAFQMGHLVGSDDQKRFEREFRSVFSGPRRFQDEDKLRWTLKVLGADHHLASDEPLSFSQALTEYLVRPVARRYRARADDSLLLHAAKLRPEAFQPLYDKYRHTVYLYLIRHLFGDRDAAEDLTQDTFFRAFRYLGQFRLSNASYGTYLVRVAHNLLLNHLRKKRDRGLPDMSVMGISSGSVSTPPDAVFDCPKLSSAERTALRLKYQDGYAVKDIAGRMNKSENAIKLLLSHARKKIKKTIMA